MMRSELDINVKRHEILVALTELAPAAMSVEMLAGLAHVVVEQFLEAQGPPPPEFSRQPCPTCGECGAEKHKATDGELSTTDHLVCMSCGERWESDAG